MKLSKNPKRSQWMKLLERPVFETQKLEKIVKTIMHDVHQNGDIAIKKYTKQFDGVRVSNLMVSPNEFLNAERLISCELKTAIATAVKNIHTFHKSQLQQPCIVNTMPGVQCWQQYTAIERVGLYVPGGTAPLLSTVLMLAVPAKIAGCKQIVLCSPPNKNGNIHPAILYAAKLTGVTQVFKIGGVQAIAAMTYGTKSVPQVYKLFGPGNQFVTMAKKLACLHGVAIDMPAGPSEVMVVADNTANPQFIAADLLSQAEHGADSQVILISNSEEIIKKSMQQVMLQVEKLPRKHIALQSLANSHAILLTSPTDIIDMINEYAPEHLILSVKEHKKWCNKIINAGSVFLGNYTPEAAGDYASGTNHTLPTNGMAKIYSGVSLDSFMKKITFQNISKQGIKNIGNAIEIMAQEEGLQAHKNAVSFRMKS